MKPDHDTLPSPVMTIREVAQYLQVHQGTLYKLIRRGQIPVFRIGCEYRFNKDAIEKWMADLQVKGRPPKSASSTFVRHSPASSEQRLR